MGFGYYLTNSGLKEMTIDLALLSRFVKNKIGNRVEVYHAWNFDAQLYEIKIVPAISHSQHMWYASQKNHEVAYIYKHQIPMDILTEDYRVGTRDAVMKNLVDEIHNGFLLEKL